jgi:hypothetical protein
LNARIALLPLAAVGLCGCHLRSAGAPPAGGRPWQLVYEETFEAPVTSDTAPWLRDPGGPNSPWHVDAMDDDGPFFRVLGGAAFARQLATFATYRKRVVFGRDGWLTAELAARDRDLDGTPEAQPVLDTLALPGGNHVARIAVPGHDGGLIIRSTRALPPRYRIEYTLVQVDFGGTRNDRWDYGGRQNGYGKDGAKTSHPWAWSAGPVWDKPYAEWLDVRKYNGFYYLAIVDHADPAPRNNIFIHTHRKVAIDSYNVPPDTAYCEVCNPVTKQYFVSQDNVLNMFFFTLGTVRESRSISETECGTAFPYEGGRAASIAAAQIVPELMPAQTYRFAIERDERGYTLEASGNFRFSGPRTLRYRRDFVQAGRPIWHYNQSAAEYDGRFDAPQSLEGPFGVLQVAHSWPQGSAYPDYFVIGDPHTNFYEGTALVDDIRLYVPKM